MSKIVKGGLFGLCGNPIFSQNIKKIEKGPLGDVKIFYKKSQKAKKNQKWGPFSLVRFCKCSKKLLDEARTRTRDRRVPPKPFGRSFQLATAYKAYKTCQFVGLQKRKVTTVVCSFKPTLHTKSSSLAPEKFT